MASIARSTGRYRRRAIGFLNGAHALDHFVILIYPTVVIELATVYGRSYSELIALGTASFTAFGLFSLPAGWLADRWSRRTMMAAFYLGSGLSLVAAALAPSLTVLAIALFALGIFGAIYHPVGTALLLENATHRGRTLAFNAVCGNLGVALAAGVTAVLTATLSWRGAFLVPGIVCVACGLAYVRLVGNDGHRAVARAASPEVAMSRPLAVTLFALFVVAALTGGLVVNTITLALPKIIDERSGFSLAIVGGLSTVVVLFGALAQIAVGRMAEQMRPHALLALVATIQLAGIVWVIYATGAALFVALAFTVAATLSQITVNDLVIARYTADAWRGRVYAVRYALTFMVSGISASMIAAMYARGGFDLVLGTLAAIASAFLVAVLAIALLAHGVDKGRAPHLAPA
jgi:predicted MFS family arabinose efflux permease